MSSLDTTGKKPSRRTASRSARRSLALIVPPTRPVPLPRIVTGLLVGFRSRLEQLFLGDAAIVPERVKLQAVELGSLLRQLAFDGAGQREIHVVAAEQDVLADGHAVERQFAIALGDGDEREVGGAAADIDDQDQVAGVDALAPVGVALDPGVEGRLRLFEQNHVAVAGLFGGRQVSSRATASKEAGTVTSTCCSANGASGILKFQASRRCSR